MNGFQSRAVLLAAFLLGTASWGQNLKQFERKVTEFTLPNGLHFIVVERHEAPVISFQTWVDSGSANDPAGATGLAHMFEHLAFKGTDTIGSGDWPAEKKALDAIEEAYDRLQAERNKGPRADPTRLDVLDLELKSAMDRAQSYARAGLFSAYLQLNGSTGLNANTFYDHTQYQCSLPSNRIELWFLMESSRFLSPVFREFYRERDVVLEEQRMRIGSNVQGALLQGLLSTAFQAHPFRNPGIGWPSDIVNLRVGDARAFFEKYYTASNMTVAIVGDVNPDEARRLAERYFGPLPTRPVPAVLHTVEPPQLGARVFQLTAAVQPLMAWGYRRPDELSPDDPVFSILSNILSDGHTSLMYQDLVQDKRVVVEAKTEPAFPIGRYPCLFAFLLAPARGHSVEEAGKALDDLITHFQSTLVDEETLTRARNKARAALLGKLDSNAGLASLLPAYYTAYGDWRKLFTSLADLNKVTAQDIQRVARRYLAPAQRTEAYVVQPPAAQAPARGGR